jgi:hypothetical protein
MAVTNDPALAARVRGLAEAEPWPDEAAVLRKLRLGQVERIAIRPRVFTWSLFPVLWVASYFQARPDVYLWESIRPLDPLPAGYRERYTNVQAALGLEGLAHLDEWTARTVAHARAVTDTLRGTGIELPRVPDGRTHVFYQYAIYADSPDEVARFCLRHGVDTEMLHVDVCTRLALFNDGSVPAPGADRAATAIQLPVHASLTDAEVARVARVVRDGVTRAHSRDRDL